MREKKKEEREKKKGMSEEGKKEMWRYKGGVRVTKKY